MYTVLFIYTVTPAWLRLSRAERRRFREEIIGPILARAATVRARFCDAEAFTARCSDFAVFETENLPAFYALFEALRDTPLFGEPYLTPVDLIVGLEDGHLAYEAGVLP